MPVLYFPLTIWMNEYITWLPFCFYNLFTSPRKLCFLTLNNFMFMLRTIWVFYVRQIWQCCLSSPANVSSFFYLPIDIKRSSENVRQNAPMLCFPYTQWRLKSPFYIVYGRWINKYIQNDSNEGYVIVEFFMMHLTQCARVVVFISDRFYRLEIGWYRT